MVSRLSNILFSSVQCLEQNTYTGQLKSLQANNREIKIHVYRIRQTANVSGEFLRIENKQLKKVQNDSCGQNWHKTTYFCVEAINSKRKIRGKLGHVIQIHVCRLA